MKFLKFVYAIFTYAITAIALVCFVLFFENIYLQQTTSTTTAGENEVWQMIVWNIALISLFGLQHSIMARDWFKKWIASVLPPSIERITYILWTSLVLSIIITQWQAFGHYFFDFRDSWMGYVMYAISFGGLGISTISALSINSKNFIGLEQLENEYGTVKKKLVKPLFYKYVRHPIYLGLLIAFWTVPVMSESGLLFNFYMTLYIIVGTHLEERNLVKAFGNDYVYYQQEVPMFIPFLKF
jgi:methanethiol S-methyltransferase